MTTLPQTQTFAQIFAQIEAESRFETMCQYAAAAWVEHQATFRAGNVTWNELVAVYAERWNVDLTSFEMPSEPELPHSDFDQWVDDMEEYAASVAIGFQMS